MRFSFLILSAICATNLFGQVNLQNGSANYEIPVFSFSDAKSGLGTSISLTYSSGNGLIISARASNVGQNWSLLAGGSIIRKQYGEPDDQNSTNTFPVMSNGSGRGFNDQIAVYDQNYQSINWSGDPYSRDYIDNYYPNGFMYSEFGLDMEEMNQNNWPIYTLAPRELALSPRFRSSMDKVWKLSRRALTDRQQDVFGYDFNGMIGQFVIGRDGNIMLINDSKISIDKTTADLTGQNIRTRIKEFTIKDVNGTIYKFAAYDLSEVMKFTEISTEGPDAFTKTIASGEPTGKYTIQKWLLTEIINPITQEKIIFQYETYSIDEIKSKTPTYQNTESQVTENVQLFEERVRAQLNRLKTIILPDGHKVELYYNTYRPDLPDDNPLNQIKVLYNDEEVYSYNLTYGYFLRKLINSTAVSVSESDRRFSRLCLLGVNKSGIGISEPSYKFDYYTGSESSDVKDIVPPFDCMAQDHWGFYNKATNVDIEDANPTKQVLKDLMVNNATYRQPSSGAAKFGLLKSVEDPFGGKLTYEYEQNDSKNSNNPSETVLTGGVRVSKTIVSDGISSTNDIVTTYAYKLSDGSTSGWGYEPLVYFDREQIKVWNASNLDGYTNGGRMKVDMVSAVTKPLIKAGVGTLAVLGNLPSGITKMLVPTLPLPQAIVFNIITQGLIQRLTVLFDPTDYIWTNRYNFFPYQYMNPIGINYSRVEIKNTSLPGGIGKTVNEFTAPTNVQSEIPPLALPYAPKQRFASWKYGLPLKTSIYNQAGTLISETSNSYSVIVVQNNSANHKSCKVEVVRPESASCWVGVQSSTIPISDFSWENYFPITGKFSLTNAIQKSYSPSGILAQAETSTSYNADNLDNVVTVTKSNGDVLKVKKYYTNDYNNISTAIQEMKNRNMIAVPISTETWLIKPNSSEYLVDATINQFNVLSNGEIKIKKIYELETKQPVLKATIGVQDPTVLVRNSTYFKEKESYNYDNNGNLLEAIVPDGRVTSKIYDYLNRIVTANVANASQSEIAYTSLETDQKGGWQYDLNNIITGDAVTGKRVLHLPSQTSITKTITGTKSYILSFWIKGTGVSVSNNSATLTAIKSVVNTASGWTYKEFTLAAPGSIVIINNSDVAFDVDELRLYPSDARMTTTAYDPKIGKTADCDANNRLLYYEYDGLNRLQYVRDDRKNILRKICYNFAGEAENCININDNSAQWRPTSTTYCVPCAANSNYNSGIRNRLEMDMNPNSPTYNTTRWVVDPTGTCPTPPDWIPRYDLTYCELNGSGVYTGNQITPTVDGNPCSPTFNQWGTPIVVPNVPACTSCIPACNAPSSKCISGFCVTGTWEIIRVQKIGKTGPWECTYAYCFPDGTVSTYTQVVTQSTACSVTCF